MDASLPLAARAPRGPGRLRRLLSRDERLAARAGRGDERAFAAIQERHREALERYARTVVSDAQAREALATAMVGAFVALTNGRRDAPLRPWLFRIAHNAAISAVRFHHVAADGAGAEREPAIEVLAALPERQRAALVMRELSGLSHREIALALGTAVGAAREAIFDGRRSLIGPDGRGGAACEPVQRAISDADGGSAAVRRASVHLRECSACTAFADAIAARRGAFDVLAPMPISRPLAARRLVKAAGVAAAGVGTAFVLIQFAPTGVSTPSAPRLPPLQATPISSGSSLTPPASPPSAGATTATPTAGSGQAPLVLAPSSTRHTS